MGNSAKRMKYFPREHSVYLEWYLSGRAGRTSSIKFSSINSANKRAGENDSNRGVEDVGCDKKILSKIAL